MGGNTVNFGSRSQFLPGDGSNEIDIKYQRYGGCFVTYKKGFFYVLFSLLVAGICGYLVYHYFGCCTRSTTVSNFFNNLSKYNKKKNVLPTFFNYLLKFWDVGGEVWLIE